MLSSILSTNRKVKLLGFIFLVAIIFRVIVALYLGDTVPVGKDENSYSTLGARVAQGFGFSFDQPWYPFAPADTPTAHWSFLYTAFVAAIYAVAGVHPLAVRLVSAVLGGILLPWMVYRLARRVAPNRENLAHLSAALAAIYAYFVLFAAQLMTETFYIVAVLWSLERAQALTQKYHVREQPELTLLLGFGASLGIATLLRQAFLPWAVILFAWLLWKGYRNKQLRTAILSLVVSGLILLLLVLPFTIRNYRVYGDFLLLNSNAGYAMYSAQHPLHGTSFQAFLAAPIPDDIDPWPENEAQWDRVLMARGLAFIREDPGRYILLSVSRIADYFMFWPSPETIMVNNAGRVISFGLFLPVMIYGLWLSRTEWRRYELLYLFMLSYTVVHLLTWSMIRYRLPVDAVLIVFASLALLMLARRATAWLKPAAANP